MQDAPNIRQDRPLQGILLMVFGMLLLSAMDVLAKLIVEDDFSPIQVLAVRGWLSVPLMLLMLPWQGGVSAIKTKRPIPVLGRGVLGFLAPFCFFTALQTISLGEATVIFFAAPMLMTALSAVLLKETVGIYRWVAVVVGFGGVVIAINPSPGEFDPVSLLVLVATFTYAMLFISGRWLSDTETTFGLVFYFNFGVMLVATVLVPFVWQPMSQDVFIGIAGISLLGVMGHISLTKAFVSAPIAIVSPFEYSALIWAVLFGYLVWGDIPVGHVWLGAGIIISSGLFIIYREHRRSRLLTAKVTDPAR